MEKQNLMKDMFLKRRSVLNLNSSTVSITSTMNGTAVGYETATESFSESTDMFYSMINEDTLQDDQIDFSPERLTAKKLRLTESAFMLQSTPQILNRSRDIREEIPELVEHSSFSSNEHEEKSTIVADIDEHHVESEILNDSKTVSCGAGEGQEKENTDPICNIKTNITKDFEEIELKVEEAMGQSMHKVRPPVPTPRAVLTPVIVDSKPIPSPRKLENQVVATRFSPRLMISAMPSNLSAIRETSITVDESISTKDDVKMCVTELKTLVEKKMTNVMLASVAATSKTERVSISSRYRKSMLPSLSTDTVVPAKKIRKSLMPPATVVPATRIRKSIAKVKSPAKKRQSVVEVVPATRNRKSLLPAPKTGRRASKSPTKKRQSIALVVKPKTTETCNRRSGGRKSLAQSNKRQSIAACATIKSVPEKKQPCNAPPPTRQSLARKSMGTAKAALTQTEYTCDICQKNFRLKSSLTAHKRLHDSIVSGVSNLKCKFCHKSFALKTAFDNHLTQYCEKIPLNEKKKLLYQTRSVSSSSSAEETTPKSSFVSNKSVTGETSTMSAPKAKAPKKKAAHSGIDRTPTKMINCRIDGCNKMFKNVLDYTTHASIHSASSSSGDEK